MKKIHKFIDYYKFVIIPCSIVFIVIVLSAHIFTQNIKKNDISYSNLDRYSYIQLLVKSGKNGNIKKEITKDNKISVSQRKLNFVYRILPIIQEVNEGILRKRAHIFLIEKRLETNSLTVLNADVLKRLFRDYNVRNGDIDELKSRVDVIPVSLAVAQAAIESGWGTSRFAIEGNAFFGQKIIGLKANGIKPKESQDPFIKVRSFNSLEDSVNAYAKNLNTHNSYKEFRKARKEQRSLSKILEGYYLVNTLKSYSELGEQYIEKVRAIIKNNNLDRYDYLMYISAKS